MRNKATIPGKKKTLLENKMLIMENKRAIPVK